MSRKTLKNEDFAELLALKASEKTDHWARALRRASRLALTWPEEVGAIVARGGQMTELVGVGPSIAAVIEAWLREPEAIPPRDPLRVDFLTVSAARKILANGGPTLRGDLQMHTTWSDGSTGVMEMALAAEARGHEFIAITDHSQGLKIAGGIDEQTLSAQLEHIAEVNRELEARGAGCRVLSSMEMNISPSGEGDMAPASLARLDLVLGSFHSQLRKKEDQTERYLAALDNPNIQVLGHPRGRIYNFRLGLTADWPRVFARAAALGKAVEIDCYPDRQDLNPALVKLANSEGCLFSIGTDSHGPSELTFIELGAASAALAGVPDERIINTWPAASIRTWAEGLRQRHAPPQRY